MSEEKRFAVFCNSITFVSLNTSECFESETIQIASADSPSALARNVYSYLDGLHETSVQLGADCNTEPEAPWHVAIDGGIATLYLTVDDSSGLLTQDDIYAFSKKLLDLLKIPYDVIF
jgi:hypothetical protein